jgi:hypothetical protein
MLEIHGVQQIIGCDELEVTIISGDEHEMMIDILMDHELEEIDSDHVPMDTIYLVHMSGLKCLMHGKMQFLWNFHLQGE